MTVIFVDISRVAGFIDRLRQHDCRSGGRVHFLIMMLFDDFDIKLIPEHPNCLRAQGRQKIDAKRHIEGEKHGSLFCGLFDACNLLRRIAGCRRNNRCLRPFCIGKQIVKNRRRRKINNHIRLFITGGKVLVNRKSIVHLYIQIDSCDNFHVAAFRHTGRNHMAHFTVCTTKQYPDHLI